MGTHAALTSESEAEQGPERRSEAGTVISSDKTDSATAVKRSARRPRKHKPRRQSAPRTVARRTPTTVDQWQTAEALRRDQLSRLPLDVPGWDHFKEAVFQTIKYAPCSAEEFGEVGGLAFVRDGNTILRPAREKKPEQVSQSAKL